MQVPHGVKARKHIGLEQEYGHFQLFPATGNEEQAGGVIIFEVLLQLPSFAVQSSPRTLGAGHLDVIRDTTRF